MGGLGKRLLEFWERYSRPFNLVALAAGFSFDFQGAFFGVALTVQAADRGDTASMATTLAEAGCTVTELAGQAAGAATIHVYGNRGRRWPEWTDLHFESLVELADGIPR